MFDLTGKEKSPLEALSRLRFGGRTYAQETLYTVTTTRSSILKNNPNRVYARIINEGTYDIRVSIDGAVSATSGFIVAANGGMISLSWEEDGESIGYELYAIAVSTSSVIRVHEVLRI